MFVWKIKNVLSSIASKAFDLDKLIQQRNKRYILAYHRIVPTEVARAQRVDESMWVSPETFSDQIDWMMRIGDMVDIETILNFKRGHTRPLFSITIDDGWKDNYEYAFPILKKYGIKATIFLATSAIETGHLFWPEEIAIKTFDVVRRGDHSNVDDYLTRAGYFREREKALDDFIEHLKELPTITRRQIIADYYARISADTKPICGFTLTWNEVAEMARYGIRFGSHTHTHMILNVCSDEEALHELRLSKEILTAKLGQNVDLFCYPNARYKPTDGALLEKTGYKFGFRLHNLPVDDQCSPYFIPRILVNESLYQNPSYFKLKLLEAPRY
jgi:peptidoglycan/xylan/chitin deacetylase (PgdA/CDA1 family)